MKKTMLSVVGLLTFNLIFSQDLITKIPANANVVATFNSARLLTLMPADEWNHSGLGKKLLSLTSKDSLQQLKSILDFGINLSANTYFFHTENDSIQYNYLLLPLSDAVKFDALFKDMPFSKLENGVRSFADTDSTGYAMWNNQQLLYVKASLKDLYFQNPDVARHHGLSLPPGYLDSSLAPGSTPNEKLPEVLDSVSSTVTEPSENVTKTSPSKIHKTTANKKPLTKGKQAATANKVKSTSPKKKLQKTHSVMPKKETTESDNSTMPVEEQAGPDAYTLNYEKDMLLKKTIASQCATVALKDLFFSNGSSSITANQEFMKNNDKNAVASIWIDKPQDLYYTLIPANMLYGKGLRNSFLNRSNYSWYKNFTAKIFLEEKQMRLTSSIGLSEEMAVTQQKIFGRKLNKKFFDYMNADSILGYMSWAMDTRAYLDSFPKMLETASGAMGLGLGSDEYSVIGELISFLLDEEAVSQLIKGDGVVLFNGLYKQETTYTDYVYDENFKSTTVEKTKTDTLPKFLLMLSSDENKFEKKLISYGMKKEVVKQREGFFEIVVPKSPVSIYFLNKDGIFFLTNSITDIQNISLGKVTTNLSKEEKQFMLDHNYTMFVSPSKISGELIKTGIGATESLSAAMNSFGKMGNIRAVMNPVSGQTMSGELIMDVPPSNKNALKYIFDVFDSYAK